MDKEGECNQNEHLSEAGKRRLLEAMTPALDQAALPGCEACRSSIQCTGCAYDSHSPKGHAGDLIAAHADNCGLVVEHLTAIAEATDDGAGRELKASQEREAEARRELEERTTRLERAELHLYSAMVLLGVPPDRPGDLAQRNEIKAFLGDIPAKRGWH